MKKFLSILMALLMTLSIIGSAALAEESVPQPEGGKKFESNWALGGGLISIVYEEFGYRVMVELVNNEDWSGTVWEYSCYYHEDTDSLVSVSSTKSSFTIDPETFDRVKDDEAYSGMDDEGQETSFAIVENGALVSSATSAASRAYGAPPRARSLSGWRFPGTGWIRRPITTPYSSTGAATMPTPSTP